MASELVSFDQVCLIMGLGFNCTSMNEVFESGIELQLYILFKVGTVEQNCIIVNAYH